MNTSAKEIAIEVIREAGKRWPTSFVPRREAPRFTGFLYSSGSFANHDCDGTGIPGAFKIGRQVCYPVNELVNWLVSKLEI